MPKLFSVKPTGLVVANFDGILDISKAKLRLNDEEDMLWINFETYELKQKIKIKLNGKNCLSNLGTLVLQKPPALPKTEPLYFELYINN